LAAGGKENKARLKQASSSAYVLLPAKHPTHPAVSVLGLCRTCVRRRSLRSEPASPYREKETYLSPSTQSFCFFGNKKKKFSAADQKVGNYIMLLS
jgi:hypothetical protein